jgi:hypothetical protein
MQHTFNFRRFVIVVLLVSIWVNASEVFRYFIIVMPETRDFLSVVPGVAPMNLPVFAIWGVWDMVLTTSCVFMFWLVSQVFGNNYRSIVIAGTMSWVFFFVLFWVAIINMALAHPSLALKALPLAWLELVVASYLASVLYRSAQQSAPADVPVAAARRQRHG